jgi:hypothetical protein
LAEASRLDFPLARLRRHGAKRLYRAPHRLAAIRSQAIVLRGKVAEILPLVRGEMFPNFTAAQDLLLPLRRQAVEVLQPLNILLLALRRQTPELGIILQSPALLIERLVTMLI